MKGLKPHLKPGSHTLVKAPNPPTYLSKEAKAEWRRVAPILVERGILTEADLGILESYVTAIGLVRQAAQEVQLLGLVLENGKRNPAVGIINSSQTAALRAANDLGLTPAARSRAGMMALAEEADDDDNPLSVR